MAADNGKDWADMVEEDVPTVDEQLETIPAGHEAKPNVKYLKDGSKVVTEIKGKDKTTKTYRTVTRERKVYKAAEERKKRWVKFGKAADSQDICWAMFEEPGFRLGKKEEINKSKIETEIEKMVNKVANAGTGAFMASKKSSDGQDAAAPAADAGAGGRYVAPGARAGEAGADGRPQRDDSCTVRITNLSEDISEDDLRQLFGKYGNISRTYVAVDKFTNVRRGFAFVTYREREDAAAAIKNLNRHPFNHVILNVDWAKPQAGK